MQWGVKREFKGKIFMPLVSTVGVYSPIQKDDKIEGIYVYDSNDEFYLDDQKELENKFVGKRYVEWVRFTAREEFV